MTKQAWTLMALAAVACGEPEVKSSFAPVAAKDQGCKEIDPAALETKVVDTSVIAGHSASCSLGITDGQGHVALGISDALGSPDMVWAVKPLRGGDSIGHFGGPNVRQLFPEEDGWIGVSQRGTPDTNSPPGIAGWSSTGELLHGTSFSSGVTAAPDFTDGAVVAFSPFDPEDRPIGFDVQRFASDAAQRSGPVQVAPPEVSFSAVGVDSHRDTLVLFDGASAGLPLDHVAGRWLDACGNFLTETFDTGLPLPWGSGKLAPLYDGSLALQVDGQWIARFPHRSTATAEPAPAWLAARPDTSLVWIRHGKGYALVPNAGVPLAECRQQIFLYSRAGSFCGAATFTVDDQPCTSGSITVGPDGTVVQLSPRHVCLDAGCFRYECSYTWWPHLLGGGGNGNSRRPERTRPIRCSPAP